MTTLSSKPNIFFTSILESELNYLTFFQSNLRTNAFNVIMTDDHIDEGNEDMTLRILFFFHHTCITIMEFVFSFLLRIIVRKVGPREGVGGGAQGNPNQQTKKGFRWL